MDQIDATSCDPFMNSFDRVGLATRRAGAFRLTDVTPTGIQWLWPGRIPFGYVTLLVSDPGAGKSLVALDVAARVSTGASWPDQASDLNPEPQTLNPSSVLLLNIEDHFATTVRPRLDALGADCSRIIGMSHVPGEGVFNMPRPVAINRDINRIEMMLREIPDCRLIILDPITAFFGYQQSVHRQHMEGALKPLLARCRGQLGRPRREPRPQKRRRGHPQCAWQPGVHGGCPHRLDDRPRP